MFAKYVVLQDTCVVRKVVKKIKLYVTFLKVMCIHIRNQKVKDMSYYKDLHIYKGGKFIMYCVNCGHQIDDSDKFCQKCGSSNVETLTGNPNRLSAEIGNY